VPNETEAAALTGIPVNDLQSAEEAAMKLLERGPQAVIITLGREGAFLATKEKKQFFPAFPIKAVDTTGAGDAFIGGFASALVESKSLEEALRMASANGALAATKPGAQTSLPNHQELDQFLSAITTSPEVH
jgi:ribokinase